MTLMTHILILKKSSCAYTINVYLKRIFLTKKQKFIRNLGLQRDSSNHLKLKTSYTKDSSNIDQAEFKFDLGHVKKISFDLSNTSYLEPTTKTIDRKGFGIIDITFAEVPANKCPYQERIPFLNNVKITSNNIDLFYS